jgi:hypothetical protein
METVSSVSAPTLFAAVHDAPVPERAVYGEPDFEASIIINPE